MYHCVTALFWVPDGKQKVGRSRTTWRRTAEKEKVEAGWGGGGGVTGINRELVQGKGRDGGALCAIKREDAR